MYTINLSNGAKIYCYGDPKLFIMSGVHGEERAGPKALNKWMSGQEEIKDTWILPLLNTKGYAKKRRKYGIYNLNGEFKKDSKLEFMRELVDILSTNVPEYFVDLHEDSETALHYIWINFDFINRTNKAIMNFCKEREDIGLFYYPEDKFYDGTSETFMQTLGCKNSFTCETTMINVPEKKRIEIQMEYIKLFYQLANGE